MRKLGIIEIADNDMNEVSGGQLQRACICRSMMNQPKLLFADEPTGALNRTSSNEVMNELVKLNSEGTTIVMVTHDAKVAARCGRVLYIVDGNIKGEYNNLKNISDEDIVGLNLPTAVPYVFDFDNDLRLINDYFLGDPEEIKKLMEAVAKQGQKK